jgi:hypothetical protein
MSVTPEEGIIQPDDTVVIAELLSHIAKQDRELAIHYDPPGFAPFWVLLDEEKYDEAQVMLDRFRSEYPDNLSLIGADTQLLFWKTPLKKSAFYYRVGTATEQQGLWYTPEGQFTGLIHTDYSFCKAAALQMPFDQELVGWLSATTTLEELFAWFSREEIQRLQLVGYYIYVYEAEHIKFYEPYKHFVIRQDTAKIVGRLVLD